MRSRAASSGAHAIEYGTRSFRSASPIIADWPATNG
jgi:hypothetical protein